MVVFTSQRYTCMLTNVISSFGLRKGKVLKLISWKHSFKRLNEEYEIAKKKKQALDNLFENGRISQATRDSFDNDINAVIMEIEKQQKDLLMKMQEKTQELESQIKTLETLLANYEIQHVVGEIDEEMYQREMTVLSTGLESARHELNVINEATSQLCPPVEETTTESALPAEENVEAVQNETMENVADAPAEMEAPAEPYSQEPAVTTENATPEAPSIENTYITPEETSQSIEETPEVVENQPEITEEISQTTEDAAQETEWQAQITEDAPQEMDEASEVVEEVAEVTEEFSQNIETEDNIEASEDMSQPDEENSQMTDNEPQIAEETLQTVEETPEKANPFEAPKEAPQEISVEVIADEEQSDEEAAETAEADEDTEYEEL
jgi:hypothetical protein